MLLDVALTAVVYAMHWHRTRDHAQQQAAAEQTLIHLRAAYAQVTGPVLAGGRLIVAGSNGALINIEPSSGTVQSQTSAGQGISLQPIVAGQTLYVLTDGGRLIAYR